MTTRTFKVAEHFFSLQLPDIFWNDLENYKPFETSESASNILFSLQYAETLNIEDKQLIFVDSSDEDMPRIEVYKTVDSWYFEMSERRDTAVCVKISVNLDFTKGVFSISNDNRHARFAIDNAAMLLYAFSSADKYTIEMHASVIKKDGYGYMFLGKSGTGKSTHSRLWMEHIEGATLLNDDNPIVRIIDGKAIVFGSPWSGKTKCYKNDYAPIKAIVHLKQAKKNEIKELRAVEAYATIYTSSSGLKIDAQKADSLHNSIAELIGKAKCCALNCLPDRDAALCCYNFTK